MMPGGRRNTADYPVQDIVAAYVAGDDTYVIARKLNCGYDIPRRLAKAAGIPPRPRGFTGLKREEWLLAAAAAHAAAQTRS